MYVWIERDLVLNLSLVVAVTGAYGSGGAAAQGDENNPRTLIHLADGRVECVRAARNSVVRRIREAHL